MNFLRSRFFHSIRGQLLASFILMTLLPALVISAGSLLSGFINGRQQVFDRLESASALKQIEIERWLEELKADTNTTLTEEYGYDRALTALTLATEDRYFQFYNGAIRNRFQILVSQSRHLNALYLLDRQGRVIVATDSALENSDMSSLDCFRQTNTRPVFQFSLSTPKQNAVMYVAVPVLDVSGAYLGVVLGQSTAIRLAEVLEDTTGLGASGKAFLIYPGSAILTSSNIIDSLQGESVQPRQTKSEGVLTFLESRNTLSGIFRNEQGDRVLGVYRWLPELGMGLAIEQNLFDAFSVVTSSLNVTLVVALVSLLGGVLVALWLTRQIASPLTSLAEAAQEITEGGMSGEVKIERQDEIGSLAKAFNKMTSQLSGLINQLEHRVAERTSALEETNRALNYRALQVETSFKVGREITSILEIQSLLQRIVDLIRQSFNYEEVLIYLLEEDSQLVLQACSPLHSSHHRILPVDNNSLNGACAITRKAVRVNDIRQDNRYLPIENRAVLSVMVIPVMIADEITGTLEVDSSHLDAFTDDDVLGIQNLADQIAIAIQNARLYARTRELAVLEERNRLSRELHDSVIQSLYSLNLLAGGWQRLLETDQKPEITQYLHKVRTISEQALREMRLLVHQLRPPVLEEVGLLDALHQRLDAVEKRSGINARLVVEGILDFPYELEEPFYWITQEALNNAIKHASPQNVSVRLKLEAKMLVLEIRDDGCGFELEKAQRGGGLGLRTMKERAKAINADFAIRTAPGQGTVIRVAAPVSKR